MRFLILGAVLILVGAPLAWLWLRALRGLYPDAWKRPPARALAYGALGLWALAVLAQPLVRLLEAPPAIRAPVSAIAGIGLLFLLITLPFLWVGRWLRAKVEPVVPEVVTAADESARWSRREIVLHGARTAPLAGVGVATMGTTGAGGVELAEIEMSFPELPPALEGLKILQYSDVHLGHFIDLDEIRALVERGREAKADLVVLTGDIADDLGQLPRALAMFSELAPRLGVYASIGNHEYFRGIMETQRAYERSRVPLLLERGQRIDVDGAALFLSGADDPKYLGRQSGDFFKRTVDSTLDGAPSDAFHVLMSHRPEGFLAAQKVGVHLTLSGHTHGAQVGFAGRSLFEPILPDKYLWGPYQEGRSRLYTSSGAGHWFPFRLGCPRELPVIKLVRGPAELAAVKRKLRTG